MSRGTARIVCCSSYFNSPMSFQLILGGWYVGDMGRHRQLPVIRNPSNDDILHALNALRNRTGVVGLKKENQQVSDHGPYELAVYAEGGKYMLMLSEYDEDGEHDVRTLTNALVPKGLAIMMGESYPANAMVEDLDLVARVLTEFAEKGDVSRALMS